MGFQQLELSELKDKVSELMVVNTSMDIEADEVEQLLHTIIDNVVIEARNLSTINEFLEEELN